LISIKLKLSGYLKKRRFLSGFVFTADILYPEQWHKELSSLPCPELNSPLTARSLYLDGVSHILDPCRSSEKE